MRETGSRVWEAMQPYSAGGVYVNYFGRETDEGVGRIKAGCGFRRYQRLASVKRNYDRTNLLAQPEYQAYSITEIDSQSRRNPGQGESHHASSSPESSGSDGGIARNRTRDRRTTRKVNFDALVGKILAAGSVDTGWAPMNRQPTSPKGVTRKTDRPRSAPIRRERFLTL